MDERFLIPIVGMMIPLTAIVLGIGVAFWTIYWDHQKKRLQYQERQLMIEKGMAPPPELPKEEKKFTPEASLRRGTVLLFLGVGFGVGYVVLANSGGDGPPPWIAGVAGAIVGFLGLGHLTYYFIARRKSAETTDSTRMPM
jgi:uncharacterized membrane protein YfcA